MTDVIQNMENMLARGQDSPLLRFTLGNACLKASQYKKACEHLHAAVAQDPKYSAAWKLLGKALAQDQDVAGAKEAYEQGIAVAEVRGDMQAAKEMRVFLKRLEKDSG